MTEESELSLWFLLEQLFELVLPFKVLGFRYLLGVHLEEGCKSARRELASIWESAVIRW